jgi:hypothetical protein
MSKPSVREAERAMHAALLTPPKELMQNLTDTMFAAASAEDPEAVMALAAVVHIPSDKLTPWVVVPTHDEYMNKHLPKFERSWLVEQKIISLEELSAATFGFCAEGYTHLARVVTYLDGHKKEWYIQEAHLEFVPHTTRLYRFFHGGNSVPPRTMIEYRLLHDVNLTYRKALKRQRKQRQKKDTSAPPLERHPSAASSEAPVIYPKKPTPTPRVSSHSHARSHTLSGSGSERK